MDGGVRYSARAGKRLEPSPELQELRQWALQQGISFPKLDYPVLFEPGYVGSQALEEIGPNEAIVTVPKSLLFMASLADESELSVIINEHPELFTSDRHIWYEDFRLIALILFERRKGRESFWYHFITTLPKTVDSVILWTDAELEELQDRMLVKDAKERLKEIRQCWKEFRETMLQYPALFTEDMLRFEDFVWAQQIVASRAFGKSVPSTSLCPIAEFLNHDTVQTYYFYGPASALQPKFMPEDDADDLPHDSEKVWPITYDALALIAKKTEALNDQTYTQVAEIARNMENERYTRMQAAAWKPMEFHVTDEFVFRILTGPTETYSKGSELYLCYGADSNRHLLIYYGFALPANRYNYEYMFVDSRDVMVTEEQRAYAEEIGLKARWCFKVREREVCLQLIRTLRALHWKTATHSAAALFSPVDFALEKEVLQATISILQRALASYSTTLAQDERALAASPENMRTVFALQYRRQRKLALTTQVLLCEALLEVVSSLQNGADYAAATTLLNTRRHEPLNLAFSDMLKPYLIEIRA